MIDQPALSLSAVAKRFGRVEALAGIDLTVPRGAFVVLLGAAGAGKTTTLRIAAGLEDPDEGHVSLHGRDVDGLQPKDRDVAMIFDNLALYPNRVGYDNIASPLRIRGLGKAEIERRVHDVSATLRIGHVLKRLPKTMSGGERQRVALGRALVREPGLFLLDEPLSSLDAMLRVELQAELKRLQKQHGYSFLLATPDYAEALAIADRIVMLIDGRVRQVGTPQEIYDAPVDRDVARFVGAPEINLLPAELDPVGEGALRLCGGEFSVPAALRPDAGSLPATFDAGLRPEHIRLTPDDGRPARAEVIDIEPLGAQAAVTLSRGADSIRATLSAANAGDLSLGTWVGLDPRIDHLVAFDSQTGHRLTP